MSCSRILAVAASACRSGLKCSSSRSTTTSAIPTTTLYSFQRLGLQYSRIRKINIPLTTMQRCSLHQHVRCYGSTASFSAGASVTSDENKSTVVVLKTKKSEEAKPPPSSLCGDDDDDSDEDTMEQMFIMGPSEGKVEWGGPTRGGQRPEPTRYGDWERKGRASDF